MAYNNCDISVTPVAGDVPFISLARCRQRRQGLADIFEGVDNCVLRQRGWGPYGQQENDEENANDDDELLDGSHSSSHVAQKEPIRDEEMETTFHEGHEEELACDLDFCARGSSVVSCEELNLDRSNNNCNTMDIDMEQCTCDSHLGYDDLFVSGKQKNNVIESTPDNVFRGSKGELISLEDLVALAGDMFHPREKSLDSFYEALQYRTRRNALAHVLDSLSQSQIEFLRGVYMSSRTERVMNTIPCQ